MSPSRPPPLNFWCQPWGADVIPNIMSVVCCPWSVTPTLHPWNVSLREAIEIQTRPGTKPVYVSPGFRVDLEGAVTMVLEASRPYRMPEPLRQAHMLSKRVRKKNERSA